MKGLIFLVCLSFLLTGCERQSLPQSNLLVEEKAKAQEVAEKRWVIVSMEYASLRESLSNGAIIIKIVPSDFEKDSDSRKIITVLVDTKDRQYSKFLRKKLGDVLIFNYSDIGGYRDATIKPSYFELLYLDH